jgi:(2Fe-2S) ferredoxin
LATASGDVEKSADAPLLDAESGRFGRHMAAQQLSRGGLECIYLSCGVPRFLPQRFRMGDPRMGDERTTPLESMLDRDALYLCVGSACHHKGACGVHQRLKELMVKYCVDDKVKLKGSFCLGPCTDGIVVYYDGYMATGVTTKTIDDIFERELLLLIEAKGCG